MKRYPFYKNSGVKWLGEIPAHWEVRRLKSVTRLSYGKPLPAYTREEGFIPVFGSNGPVGFHSIPNTLAPVIVIGRKGSFGKLNFSRQPCFAIDTTYYVDARNTNAELRWLFYALSLLKLDALSQDTAIPGLSRGFVYEQWLPIIPSSEQIAISNFLDCQLTEINQFIENKEKLIVLLKEQKTALIHRAITDGNNLTTRRKPSGIKQLGEIPEHWEVKRAKYYFCEIDERSEAGKEELLSVSHITGVTPRNEKNVTMFMAESYEGYKTCRQGDLVINIMWAWMGALGVSGCRGIVSSSYGVYRQKQNLFDWHYLNYLLRTRPYVAEFTRRSTGIHSSRLRMYTEDFFGIPIIRPPLDEQKRIVRYIEQEHAQIDIAISIAEREINLIKEFRASLISEVITGKIDVCTITPEMLNISTVNITERGKEALVKTQLSQ